jgi:hypothetical protein
VTGAWWFGAPPAPESEGAGCAGGGPHEQLCSKHEIPGAQFPQSMSTPQTVPEPQAQSTPHFGKWQHVPPTSHLSDPQLQSVGQVAQFSPERLAQIPSPQTGLHVPPWHVVPEAHAPQVPPQPSGPHVTLVQAGEQQLGGVPGLHTWPPAHAQSCGHELQFSLAVGWQV